MDVIRARSSHFRNKIGASPGSYRIIPDIKREKADISIYRYGPDIHEVQEGISLGGLKDILSKEGVKWLRINRLHDPDLLDWLRENLGIDPMVLEDLVNADVKPKLEEHADLLFMVAKLPYLDAVGQVRIDHVAVMVMDDIIITVTESQDDVFDHLAKRLESPKGRMRSHGAGYMAYAVFDSLLDSFILVSKIIEEDIEALEDVLNDDSADELMVPINNLKRKVSKVRKEAGPMHQLAMELQASDSDLVGGDHLRVYLNDLLDHTNYVNDSLETCREVLIDMHQLCLAIISNNMNKVMKVLTVVATIFIPLTFIAGIYGMNFVNMPELEWEYGYFASLAVMSLVAIGMLLTFRRRRWF